MYEYYIALITITPLWCFYVIEEVFNNQFDHMTWKVCIGNILCMTAVFLVCYFIIPKKKLAVGIFWTIFYLFGIANYYVERFRGSPIMPSDIFSFQTAMQVAGSYEFTVTKNILIGTLCYFAAISLLCSFPVHKKKSTIRSVIIKLTISFMILSHVWNLNVEKIYNFRLVDQQWTIGNMYKSVGSTLSFLTMLQNLRIKKPEGYKTQTVEQLLQKSDTSEMMIKPTVIAIMDETFSDLRALSDFPVSEEYLKYWYEREDYLYRGNLSVSTFGGGTANTEFEFLTGNSLGNLPAGVSPYQLYNLKHVGNLAAVLKSYGYTTTAIHPEYKGNWNRMRVYNNFGFETFLGIDDFKDSTRIANRVSDRSSFEKIIEVFENKRTDTPQFIFNVTMQNHGGYNIDALNDRDIIQLEEKWQEYTDVSAYLTLIRESDLAIKYLLEYFRTVKEPVIICIFGDHQPGVNGAWIEEVMGKPAAELSLEEMQKKYIVPYMIWANYEIPIMQQTMDTSANYLGALLLHTIGITTGYTKYLLQMQEQIPAVNAFGYLTKDGLWHTFEEETDVLEWIRNYQLIQYHAMFDPQRNTSYYKPQ